MEEDDNVALLARGKNGRAKKQASNSGGKGNACEATSAGSPSIQVQLSTTSRASYSIWYVDSGASCHMTGVKEYLLELLEDDTDMEVALADDNMVREVCVGTLTFDRGPKATLKVSDFLYVPRMKKNLISISTLDDRGYDVLFRREQVLIYHRGNPSSLARVIGVFHAKVYKFSFQLVMALSRSTQDKTDNRSRSSELCDIWHCRMGHMYHGAL
eukprot:PITA_16874